MATRDLATLRRQPASLPASLPVCVLSFADQRATAAQALPN
ncbi:hypothetical protein [Phaeobacter inhibens]|nr:hypothetical protein [Phaeobacter inhibens]